jgi:sulfate adenylyltransferase
MNMMQTDLQSIHQSNLMLPHGGKLVDLYFSPLPNLKEYRSLSLSDRQLCDLELLLNGGFSPLNGFMNQNDYESVVESMRLQNGLLWPMPITLDVTETFAQSIAVGETLVLCDHEQQALALLTVTSCWKPNKTHEAQHVFGTEDELHPGVHYLLNRAKEYYVGGTLQGIRPPVHYDFQEHRHTPNSLRQLFQSLGWSTVVAFQTRNPMHRAHVEITKRAAQSVNGNLVIHPVVGMTKPGDIDHYSRVRCYEKVIARQPDMFLSLLPLAMRMGGPREALWHAIIRQNFGFTHFIVGRDHAGPGKNSQGHDFYEPYAAQDLLKEVQHELAIQILPFPMMSYVLERQRYCLETELLPGETVLNISGTEFRHKLEKGESIPEWFSYPEVVEELQKIHPPRQKQGFVIFMTGFSGAGKSTISEALMVKLLASGGRRVTMLDGDQLRLHLSSELGFSKDHRDLNVRRVGYVAGEIAKHGGVALCALIAPYAQAREDARHLVESQGGRFIEVFIDTALNECENRDPKGLYAKVRRGEIKTFTGISDPYEPPVNPDLRIHTHQSSVSESVQSIYDFLIKEGLITQMESVLV